MLPFLFAKTLHHGLPLNQRVTPIVTAIAADNEKVLYGPKHLCNAHSITIINLFFSFPYLCLNICHYKSKICEILPSWSPSFADSQR
jgi:hypothetical protein